MAGTEEPAIVAAARVFIMSSGVMKGRAPSWIATYSILLSKLLNAFRALETLSFLVFPPGIIRNGIVKYYYELYKSKFTYETLDDIFRNNEWEHSYFQAHIFSDLHALYTFYYAYTHDIFTPLFPLYDKTKIDIEEARSRLSQAKSENFYFDEGHEEINIELPSYSGFCKNNLTLIEKIDCMSGKEFEAFIATLFQKKGFKVSQTPLSGDFGIDVIIENSLIKIGIQTKCYNDKVSNSAVQEAVTGIKHYNLDKAMVITNNYFQPSAIALAKDNNVILWDRDKLLQEIEGD